MHKYSANEDDDWRSQMDSKYSGSEYNELINANGKLNRSMESMHENFTELDMGISNRVFDAIRFPPYSPIDLPHEIHRADFQPEFDYKSISTIKRGSVNSSDCIAGLEFLEGMLQTVVGKAIDIRNNILENGRYIYALSEPPTKEETIHVRSVVLENLFSLRDEALHIISEMAMFHPDRVNEMINSEALSAATVVLQMKTSLLERATNLKHEIAESALVIDGLVHYGNSIIDLPTDLVCKLDGISTDWTIPNILQGKIRASNKSLNFAAFMCAHGFPVCNAIYSYLQSSKSYGNMLVITDYRFLPNEFKTVMNFFEMQHKNIVSRNRELGYAENNYEEHRRQCNSRNSATRRLVSIFHSIRVLIIQHCDFNDKDCHALSSRLEYFAYLDSLNLRDNIITYSGIASLAATLFEKGSNMRSLRLDCNNIDTDGALLIAQVMPKLPYLEHLSLSGNPIEDKGVYQILKRCLNPHRAAASRLPKPTVTRRQSQAGASLGTDTDNEDEDEENNAVAVAVASRDVQKFATTSVTERQKQLYHIAWRKVMRKCFFSDYFRSSTHSLAATNTTTSAGAGGGVHSVSYENLDDLLRLEANGDTGCETRGRDRDDIGGIDRDDEMERMILQQQRTDLEKEQWFNKEEDEFYMDATPHCEYSDDDDIDYDNIKLSTAATTSTTAARYNNKSITNNNNKRSSDFARNYREPAQSNTSSYADVGDGITNTAPAATLSELLAAKREALYSQYPKIIQMIMKLRLRLVAVNAFLQVLYHPKCILTSLAVSNCNLTSAIIPSIAAVLKSNRTITALDISHNANILRTHRSCAILARALESQRGGSILTTADFSYCGITDAGFETLTRVTRDVDTTTTSMPTPSPPPPTTLPAASAAATAVLSSSHPHRHRRRYPTALCNVDFSGNYLGPTGANLVATLNKNFYIDKLDISGGFHSRAPFKKKKSSTANNNDDDNVDYFDPEYDSQDDANIYSGEDYEDDDRSQNSEAAHERKATDDYIHNVSAATAIATAKNSEHQNKDCGNNSDLTYTSRFVATAAAIYHKKRQQQKQQAHKEDEEDDGYQDTDLFDGDDDHQQKRKIGSEEEDEDDYDDYDYEDNNNEDDEVETVGYTSNEQDYAGGSNSSSGGGSSSRRRDRGRSGDVSSGGEEYGGFSDDGGGGGVYRNPDSEAEGGGVSTSSSAAAAAAATRRGKRVSQSEENRRRRHSQLHSDDDSDEDV